MSKQRKFFLQLSSGEKFEISEIDFNNLQHRQATGRTNGWYKQRGDLASSKRFDWAVQFKEIAGWWADEPKRENKEIRNIDIEKRVPPKVGATKKKNKPKNCHDWNNEDTWEHVTTIVNGVNRYFKQCKECGVKSTLVKKREVELRQERLGLTMDDVLFVE